jgi:prepilin-type N-terminal cleavage/methylation domain-containing protein
MKRCAFPRRPGTTRNGAEADAGFSLVELMMAMAVFGALMVIVSAATLQGFSGIREVMKRTNSVADAQVATEWLAKQIRYTSRRSSPPVRRVWTSTRRLARE